MRHRNSGRQLNRNSSHRKAMFRNMTASLIDHEVKEAFYLSIDGGEARPAALSAGLLAEAGEAIERLREIFARIRDGGSLPAQGTSSTCQWCELHGLCRKQHWHEDTSTDSPA